MTDLKWQINADLCYKIQFTGKNDLSFHIFISKGECSLANTNKEFYNAAYKVSTKLCNFLKSTLS